LREKSLLPSLPSSSLSSSSASSSPLSKYNHQHHHYDLIETEERLLQVDQKVDNLLQRMEILDQSMARRGRLRQQRQRARRAALVEARTTLHR
jgi:hypothetical protein